MIHPLPSLLVFICHILSIPNFENKEKGRNCFFILSKASKIRFSQFLKANH
ncbi:hypothetical protein BATR1942_01010 [Bacillus atrophaeus 1942]|uniref:Uncharacterized protein n=1 Tax=Bacillus atrophaeus (strain 1942) TaxID=720555 RepID=A0ABM5LTK4_BACA1|nr:hypothetical protein BATR1942_01010 [Bacillus atrophaeus 1942]